jgi:hypothetical protein
MLPQLSRVKTVECGATLLYSIGNGILLRRKELPKTRRFESLLRHQKQTKGRSDSPGNGRLYNFQRLWEIAPGAAR